MIIILVRGFSLIFCLFLKQISSCKTNTFASFENGMAGANILNSTLF